MNISLNTYSIFIHGKILEIVMKKVIAALVVVALIVIYVLSGSKAEKSKITVWTQESADVPAGKMFEERVNSYNKAHPDKIQVEIANITRAGAGSGYIDRLNASITAGDMPDIFTLDGPDVAAYAESGVIGRVDNILSPGFKEGFTSAMIDQGTIDGKLYALGYQDSGVVIMYNEEMIDALPADIKALVPTSTEDWTWAEFVTLAEKIDDFAKTTDNPAFANYEVAVSLLLPDIRKGAYELGTYYFTPLLWGAGGKLIAEDGVTVEGVLNSSKNVEALAEYARLFKQPVAGAEESDKAFNSGKTALAVAGFWYITDLVENYPNLKFRSLRYPKMSEDYDGLYTPSGSWAFVRSAGIKDEEKLEQVADVLEWLTNDDAAELYYKKGNAIPGRKAKVGIINTSTDNKYYNEAWEVLKYQVSNTNKSRPVSPGYPYLSETFAKDIILRIAQNKVTDKPTIKQYLDDATAKISKEMKKFSK